MHVAICAKKKISDPGFIIYPDCREFSVANEVELLNSEPNVPAGLIDKTKLNANLC